MTCQRCGVEAELGLCPGPCRRRLCVTCYDGDSDSCQPAPLELRDDAIRALRGSVPVKEIAKSFGLSRETVWRVTSGR
jgi:hypothetical protein